MSNALIDAAQRMEFCATRPTTAPVTPPTRSRGLSEFRPTKSGTNRAKLLRMAHDGATLKEMAQAINSSTGNVCTTFSCLRRDCGIDYAINRQNNTIQLFFPEGKSIVDAIK